MDLVPQIVEIKLVHEAAGDPQDLPRLRLAVVPVRHAEDAHAAVFEPLDDAILFAHVAGKPVEAFDDQDVEASGERIGEQRATAWAMFERDGPAYRLIGVLDDDFRAELISAPAADSRLRLDRRVGLAVRGKTTVDCDAGHLMRRRRNIGPPQVTHPSTITAPVPIAGDDERASSLHSPTG
jgi:hypothetical protein